MIEIVSICSIVSKKTKQKYEELEKKFCVNRTQKEVADLDRAIIESGIDTMLNKEPSSIQEQMEDAFSLKDTYRIIEIAGLSTNANFPGMINLYIPKNGSISNSHDMHLICDGFGYTQADKKDIVTILSDIKENIEKSISNIQTNRLD